MHQFKAGDRIRLLSSPGGDILTYDKVGNLGVVVSVCRSGLNVRLDGDVEYDWLFPHRVELLRNIKYLGGE